MTAIQGLVPYQYKGKEVRLTQDNSGEIWFVAKDICEDIGIKNSRSALAAIPDDEKDVQIFDTPGGRQDLNVISESGRYRLTMRSTRPEAKPFQDWVVKDVLPSIRKTGAYSIPGTNDVADLIGTVKDLVELVRGLITERKPERIAPPSIPGITLRTRINEIVRAYVSRPRNVENGYGYEDAWNDLYLQFSMRYHIDLKARARKRSQMLHKEIGPLDIAEQDGCLMDLFTLAQWYFGR
jgi:prophage antirepressor-like protein